MLKVRLRTRKSLIEFLAASEGACCAQGYVEWLAAWGTIEEQAAALGVAPKTLLNWRKKARQGTLSACPACTLRDVRF